MEFKNDLVERTAIPVQNALKDAGLNASELSKVLLVGDSLGADIIGGINYGIDTCWYNPKGIDSNGVKPTYEIKCLKELFILLVFLLFL